MGDDQIREQVTSLAQTNKISEAAARQARSNPVEGEKLLRMVKIETALFGDDDMGIKGLIGDMRDMKIGMLEVKNYIWRATWWLAGACTVISGGVAVFTLWIEYTRH